MVKINLGRVKKMSAALIYHILSHKEKKLGTLSFLGFAAAIARFLCSSALRSARIRSFCSARRTS